MSEYEGGNYKYCIDCWKPKGEVEFYEEAKGYEWQHCQRCKECERAYVQKFLDKYPGTKLKHRHRVLNNEEKKQYKRAVLLERLFIETEEDFKW